MDSIKATWPGWNVVRVIGQGSFGAVYEIQREMFGKIESAALKVITIPQHNEEIQELRSEGYDDASLTTHFRSYLEDIAREYSLMLDIKGHTNVVYCDDVRYIQHEDGIGWDVFIKMELLSPLMNTLSKVYDEQQVIKLGMDLCNALILCKNENIIHRDIKPQNIFVSKTGDYKLGDFGVAKIADKTVSGTKIGTFKYMAPEIYKSQPYGTSSDLYSLGLVLYWAMNERRTPFLPLPPQIPTPSVDEEARQRRFNGEPIPAPVNGSEELKRIVLKACAFSPADRFQDPAQMKEALAMLRNSHAGETWHFSSAEMGSVVGSFGDEDKTAGTFGGNRGFVTAEVSNEDKTVGTFGGNRGFVTTEVDNEDKTVGAFGGNRGSVVTQVHEEDKTVGAFNTNRGHSVNVKEEDKTVGAFGNHVVHTNVGNTAQNIGGSGQTTGNRNAGSGAVHINQGNAAKTTTGTAGQTTTAQVNRTTGNQTAHVNQVVNHVGVDVGGTTVNVRVGTGSQTTAGTTTTTQIQTEKKKGKWIVLGTLAGVLLAAAIAWFSFTGWMDLGGNSYYVINGKPVKGFLEMDGVTYCFDAKGRMRIGWNEVYGDMYYFDYDGIMKTGWQDIYGDRYYFQENGAMWKGWLEQSGKKYFMDMNGIMFTGWQEIAGTSYYFDENGCLVTGWLVDDDGNYSYCDENGVMLTGWQTLEEQTYYFDPETGHMATGWYDIDEQTYAFDENGVQLLGWVEAGGDIYYMSRTQNGAMAKGKWSIDGKLYFFNESSGIMTKGVSVKLSDHETLYFDNDGNFLYREVTEGLVWGDWSEDDVRFSTASGGEAWGAYQILDKMYENVTSMILTTEVVEVTEGDPTGKWQVVVRNQNGTWEKIGYFDLANKTGVFEADLDKVSFDAYATLSYDTSDGWRGSKRMEINQVVYETTDFGELNGTE